jgi:flagellar biosynthetic protein FliP
MIKILFVLLGLSVFLGAESVTVPTMNFQLDAPTTPQQLVSSLNVLVLLTLLFLAPSMVLVMTTFTRFVIVFGFLRQALGTQQV